MNPLAILIGLGSQLIGNLFNMGAARRAEMESRQAAERQRQLAQEALAKTDLSNIAGSMAQKAVGRVGGALAGQGTFGSSLANQTYQGVLSDVLSRLAPAQQQGMLEAYRMMMQPEQNLMGLYGQGARDAAQSGGMDLSFLGWLPQMTGGATGQSSNLSLLDFLNTPGTNPGFYGGSRG